MPLNGWRAGWFRWYVGMAPLVAGLLLTSGLVGQTGSPIQEGKNPLAPFEPLIGGEWYLEDSYQLLEWGVGKLSVKSKSFVVVDGAPQLVSEGFWYWHPEEGQIKGVFTAVQMPAVLFDYTTRFEEGVMVSDLVTFDSNGQEAVYVETWSLVDDDHYRWALSQESGGSQVEIMNGLFTRRR